jgi:ACS family pantothenate transporter-like MFS transporter
MYAMIAVSIGMALWTALLVWMQVRTEKKRAIEGGVTSLEAKESGLGDTEDVHHIEPGREKV